MLKTILCPATKISLGTFGTKTKNKELNGIFTEIIASFFKKNKEQ